jgi:hypothetical protein
VANVALALLFWMMSHIALMTLTHVNVDVAFLLQIGSLLVAGIFLVRTLINVLQIVDKTSGLFLRWLKIKEDWSRERFFKDTIYIIAILLLTAAIFPIISNQSTFGPLLQGITTYVALGLILLFVYDIGRTFYRITEKKANAVANRISSSSNKERKLDEK